MQVAKGITAALFDTVAGGKATSARSANIASIVLGLERFGRDAGLARPSRLSHFIPQLAHESGRFRHDREVWGPTKAQRGYEGRKDLGNIHPGDGSKFRGYTPMQITGRFNTTAFWEWCKARFENVPNFVESPHLMNTDPWEGLGPIWYWEVGNPDSRSLNRYADQNNIEMVTRRINGGLNGYADRLVLFDRTALTFLGYKLGKGVIKSFQMDHDLVADDVSGPLTRAAMHGRLKVLDGEWLGAPAPAPEPEVPINGGGEIVTPAWGIPEHLANIRASSNAIEILTQRAA